MELDPFVAQIILKKNFDNFSTNDVRSGYLTLKNDESLDPSIIRKKIYAELLKLVRRGWLTKVISKPKGLTRFKKTVDFNSEAIVLKTKPVSTDVTQKWDNTQEQLLRKLNQYKAELLLNIGESEAYKELYSELPKLVNSIQPQYNLARDNNTKILGKIRAIEGLLKQEKPFEKI